MIQSIRLQNFKGVRDIKVGLERLTVFVGPNGSGKTSILQAIELLSQAKALGRDFLLNNIIYERGYRDEYSEELYLAIYCSTKAGEIRLQILPSHQRLQPDNLPSFADTPELIALKAQSAQNSADDWKDLIELPEVTKSLGVAQLFRFESSRMAESGAPADSGRLFCLSVQPGSFQGTREVFMAMLDLDQLTPFQRLTVERALVLAQQLEATAEAAPHGQIIHRIESHLLGNGRDFLRKTLEDSLQSRVDALEKKGHPHKLVLAVKPDATKADPNAR